MTEQGFISEFFRSFVNCLPLFREKQDSMSTNNNDYSSMSYSDRLNAIHRLRLLRNTTGELSAHTGIQLRNNSFNKKAPFIARCIYSEFCREVRERASTDLDELMTDYCAASRSFEKISKTRKAQPEFHREVLRCLLDDRFAVSEAAKPYRAAADSLSNVDAALFTLLILNVLPSFQAKGGDVDPNMHFEYLIRLRDYFRPLYEESRVFGFAPYLTEMYQDSVRRIRKGELFTRLDLIHFTQEIIANLANNHNPESLLQANSYINRQKIHPDLVQGAWRECDSCGGNPVYWLFEELGMDYILIRRMFDEEASRITERRYEVSIYQENEAIAFQLLRQSEVEKICTGGSILEQAYMSGSCTVDNPQMPQRIEWEFKTNRYDDFPLILTRSEDDSYVRLVESAMAEGWEVVCETGDYEYLPAERVITSRYIYIECESVSRESEREIVSWYRVPRTGLLEAVEITTPIARICHAGCTFICFIPMKQSFNVTDDEARAASDIEIVRHIEVTV